VGFPGIRTAFWYPDNESITSALTSSLSLDPLSRYTISSSSDGGFRQGKKAKRFCTLSCRFEAK